MAAGDVNVALTQTSAFKCNVFEDETTDSERIYNLTKKAMRSIKKTAAPSFLYLKYYRYLEHVGVNEDFEAEYRLRGEFEKWYRVDPIKLQRTKLLKIGFSEKSIDKIEARIDGQILLSLKKAKSAKFANKKELYKDVLYEGQ